LKKDNILIYESADGFRPVLHDFDGIFQVDTNISFDNYTVHSKDVSITPLFVSPFFSFATNLDETKRKRYVTSNADIITYRDVFALSQHYQMMLVKLANRQYNGPILFPFKYLSSPDDPHYTAPLSTDNDMPKYDRLFQHTTHVDITKIEENNAMFRTNIMKNDFFALGCTLLLEIESLTETQNNVKLNKYINEVLYAIALQCMLPFYTTHPDYDVQQNDNNIYHGQYIAEYVKNHTDYAGLEWYTLTDPYTTLIYNHDMYHAVRGGKAPKGKKAAPRGKKAGQQSQRRNQKGGRM
jgi:uncharacterized membrane protein